MIQQGLTQVHQDMCEGFKRVDERFAQVTEEMKRGFAQVDVKIDSLSADLRLHARRIGEVNSAHAICDEVKGNVRNFVHVERGGPSACVTVRMKEKSEKSGSDNWSTEPPNNHVVLVGYDPKGIAVHAFDRILDLN